MWVYELVGWSVGEFMIKYLLTQNTELRTWHLLLSSNT